MSAARSRAWLPQRSAPGVSLQAVIVLALPMVAVQAFLLDASYAERNSAIALIGTELSGR
jgi:hypothetical protein